LSSSSVFIGDPALIKDNGFPIKALGNDRNYIVQRSLFIFIVIKLLFLEWSVIINVIKFFVVCRN